MQLATNKHTASQMSPVLETPKQLAERVEIPISNIRYLIKTDQLEVIYTTPGRRNPKIPEGAWERYIESQRKN